MGNSSKTTTDHEEIRRWVEERGGHPAVVRGTAGRARGILRIDFPGYIGSEALEEISWDEFFRNFEESKLAFLYQERTADGRQSRFAKFVNRITEGELASRASGPVKGSRGTPGSTTKPRGKKAA
jgi:hypothetical protein